MLQRRLPPSNLLVLSMRMILMVTSKMIVRLFSISKLYSVNINGIGLLHLEDTLLNLLILTFLVKIFSFLGISFMIREAMNLLNRHLYSSKMVFLEVFELWVNLLTTNSWFKLFRPKPLSTMIDHLNELLSIPFKERLMISIVAAI